jgi:hypothetical protein
MDAKYTTNQQARHDLFRIRVAHREPNMSLKLTDSKLIQLAQREGFFKSDKLMLMGQPLFGALNLSSHHTINTNKLPE